MELTPAREDYKGREQLQDKLRSFFHFHDMEVEKSHGIFLGYFHFSHAVLH